MRCPACLGVGKVLVLTNQPLPEIQVCCECLGLSVLPASADDLEGVA